MKFKLIYILICLPVVMSAQVLDQSALDTMRTYFNMESALKNPDNVYKLILRKKKLKEIPMEIFTFKNLNVLILSKNHIKVLPAEIGNLTNLQKLDISNNKIDSLPPTIGNLKALKELIIYKNEIYTMPEEIGQLTELRYIDAWSNNFASLPESMVNLKKLEKLDMRAIMFDNNLQQEVKKMLPNTEVYFDKGCDCGYN